MDSNCEYVSIDKTKTHRHDTRKGQSEENRKLVQLFMSTTFQPDWWNLLHEEIVLEFPYAPSLGFSERFAGRQTVTGYLKALVDQVGALKFRDVVVLGTEDSELFVNEYKATATAQNGTAFEQVYINKIRLKEGKVVFMREFWDPARIIQANSESKAS